MTLLDCAKQWGAIEVTPVKAKRLRVPKRRMDFFRFDEYTQLVDAATEIGPVHLAVALLGGDAGLRAGEIRGLHWTSIEWSTRQLTVERSEWRGQFTTGTPRTETSGRRPTTSTNNPNNFTPLPPSSHGLGARGGRGQRVHGRSGVVGSGANGMI